MTRLLHKLGRSTVSTRYLPEIDGLRFVAILAVIFFHLADDLYLRQRVSATGPSLWLVRLLSHGDRGVQLFFAISGFILAVPFARRYLAGGKPPPLSRYFLRRLTRLEPPYLLNVLVCTAATWLVTAGLRGHLLPHFLTAVTYTHALVFHYNNPINMVWWSLEVECQFYLLMPLLAQVYRIRSVALRRGLLLGAALSAFLWQHPDSSWIIRSSILFSIQYFLIGLLFADLVESAPTARSPRWTWDVAGFAALATLFCLPSWWRLAAPFLLLVVLSASRSGVAFRRALSLSWVATLGGMCYTIYLWHLFVMAALLKVTGRFLLHDHFALSFALQAALILPVLLGVSILLFLFVEKPCMEPDWYRHLLPGTTLRKQRAEPKALEPGMAASLTSESSL